MKYFRLITLAILVFAISNSSCKKTVTITNTVIDTVTHTVIDTFLIRSVDTTFAMNAKSWNYFSYQSLNLIDSGSASYLTTSEGIKFIAQGYRLGGRLQTKSEVGFNNKVVYFKWKANGAGQFAAYVPQIKYDALSNDGAPALQGVDLGIFTVNGTVVGSIAIQENVWYYTRLVPVFGTDTYQVITATNNYNNLSGNVVSSATMPVYTKSGYIAIRIGDPYGSTSAYCVIGECKIAPN